MVFFTCSQCGQSVKKNQVEKHCMYQCRNCQSLSCMDCNKEFWGDDYKNHTKCITEDQKYGGKDYVAKPSSNKGEIKQEQWIEHINNTIATKKLSGPLSKLLNQVIEYPNIPRKQAKFKNFLENSLNVRNPKLISEAWEIFAQSTKGDSNNSSKENPTTNGTNGSVKRPIENSDEPPSKKACTDSAQNIKQNSETFDWCAACEKILQHFPLGISEKVLRKEVIALYKMSLGGKCTLSNKELKKKFRNILSNSSMFSLFDKNCNKSMT